MKNFFLFAIFAIIALLGMFIPFIPSHISPYVLLLSCSPSFIIFFTPHSCHIPSLSISFNPPLATAEVVQINSAEQFNAFIASQPYSLIGFGTGWCGHCKNLKPIYDVASKQLEDIAQIAWVDCASESGKPLCASANIRGYPTLIGYHGTPTKSTPYKSARTADAIVANVKANLAEKHTDL
jgi:thiol-disulfide isomerase/thioredoxin